MERGKSQNAVQRKSNYCSSLILIFCESENENRNNLALLRNDIMSLFVTDFWFLPGRHFCGFYKDMAISQFENICWSKNRKEWENSCFFRTAKWVNSCPFDIGSIFVQVIEHLEIVSQMEKCKWSFATRTSSIVRKKQWK